MIRNDNIAKTIVEVGYPSDQLEFSATPKLRLQEHPLQDI
jgi:hypothetical protein